MTSRVLDQIIDNVCMLHREGVGQGVIYLSTKTRALIEAELQSTLGRPLVGVDNNISRIMDWPVLVDRKNELAKYGYEAVVEGRHVDHFPARRVALTKGEWMEVPVGAPI